MEEKIGEAVEILSLQEVAEASGGKLYKTGGASGITGAVIDNRLIEPGGMFIAVPGERTDGHRFIDAAFDAGAACVISEQELEKPKGSYILVKSSLEALRKIAAYYRNKLSIPFIGITGSVGKTGTKEMIASVLSEKFNVHKTQGNFNNDIGLPLTIMGIRPWHDVAVTEMGISGFGEMDLLSSIAKPDMMVFTNIRECHLEFLGDLDGVFRAKTEVLAHMKNGSHVFVNADDSRLRKLTYPGLAVHTYGTEHGVIRGRITEDKVLEGSRVEITYPEEENEVSFIADINIVGRHKINHVLAATSIGLHMGLSKEEIISGISSARAIDGRGNAIKLANGVILIDGCYNASPASMDTALSTLSMTKGRRIAVLGDMGELGEDKEALHRAIAANPGFKNIDCVFTGGKLSAYIIEELKERGFEGVMENYEDTESLSERVIAEIRPDDVILVKASHFMHFDRIVDNIRKALPLQSH